MLAIEATIAASMDSGKLNSILLTKLGSGVQVVILAFLPLTVKGFYLEISLHLQDYQKLKSRLYIH